MDPWKAKLVNRPINIQLNINIIKTYYDKQNTKGIYVYSYLLQINYKYLAIQHVIIQWHAAKRVAQMKTWPLLMEEHNLIWI